MNHSLTQKKLECDICVIGGGLSGSFAALSAARHGARVVLMQDRPMLGGNASSEIRMWVRGAKGTYDRETGLISELEERNIHGNPTLVHSLFDATLYGMLRENEKITLLLNTTCLDATTDGDRICSVTGWQMTTYTVYTVEAPLFLDCSGDSILAPLVGADYRHGREGTAEYGETLAPKEADHCTMGMSIILAARETDHPVSFIPPSFANVYEDDSCFSGDVGQSVHAQIRSHKIATSGGNLWWVELGGEGNSILDADRVRDELLAAIYGVWDHIKNRGDHGMENWELDWVGFLPGKRESRRYVGDYVMTEHDIVAGGHFDDEVAYGGWPMDDHNPYGMRRNPTANLPSVMIPVTEIYGIPLRSLYSKNIRNLMFAGRNISVTHAALSSTRVMATCALIGQAAGTAASVAICYGLSPRETAANHTEEIQRMLMDDGMFLPHLLRHPSALTQGATLNLSEEERARLLNGLERPRQEGVENGIFQDVGDELCFSFDSPRTIGQLRLQFDPDFGRLSISDNVKMRVFAMKLHTGKDFVPVRVAATIVKDFAVYADGREVARIEGNFRSLVKLPLNVTAKTISIRWLATNGAEQVHLFSADLLEA
ncbi:MAG: FAD-dependent oxidoreductase [Clostridia bacterium]|nr:FAD-dependent oxidoreductase [Clostridia bacterium]